MEQREIKFRVWITRYDEPYMLELESSQVWFDYENGFVLGFSDEGVPFSGYDTRDIDKPFKIMQYTGLKDKNGKEIYESDVVEGTHTNGFLKMYNLKYVVVYSEDRFWLKCIDERVKEMYPKSLRNCIDEIEIIGNIHEHSIIKN